MGSHEDLNPVPSTTTSASILLPSARTTYFFLSCRAYPTARVGAMTAILPFRTCAWNPSEDGLPRSLVRIDQNVWNDGTSGEADGTSRTWSWIESQCCAWSCYGNSQNSNARTSKIHEQWMTPRWSYVGNAWIQPSDARETLCLEPDLTPRMFSGRHEVTE